MDWKTRIKQQIERLTNVRIYRYSLPRGVDFAYDARRIIDPKKVSVIFDVGANIGQSAEKFVVTYPNARILCFEPVHSTSEILKSKATDWRQVEVYPLAFGSAPERKYICKNPDSISSINSFVKGVEGHTLELVQIDTLDAFCEANKIEKIDLLKIDVEGFELEVLRGAERMLSENRIDFLYLESAVHVNDNDYFVPLTALDQFLSAHDYSIFGIYEQEPERLKKRDYLYYFNAAFIRQELCGYTVLNS